MMATPAAPPPAQGGRLNVIALISGGKDSFFSLLHCLAHGHRVVALANLHPPETNEHEDIQQEEEEDEDLNSFMYQTVGHQLIPLYAEATGIPLYRQPILGGATQGKDYSHFSTAVAVQGEGDNNAKAKQVKDDDETESMIPLLLAIKRAHPEANAICAGAILSTYQRTRVESVAVRLGLTPLAFLWKFPILPVPQHLAGGDVATTDAQLLDDMAAAGMEARIIKVASGGLDDSFLWTNVADRLGKERIARSMRRFGTASEKGAVIGEGGEFETLVLDGPRQLFRKRIMVEEKDRRVVREGGGCAWLSFRSAKLEDKEVTVAASDEEKSDTGKIRIPDLLDARFVGVLEGLNTSASAGEEEARKLLALLSLEPQHSFSKQEGTFQLGLPQSLNDSKLQQWCFFGNASFSAGSSNTVETETSSLVSQIRQRLQQSNLTPSAILTSTILLRHMADFPTVNSIYGALFDSPNPPSRVCVACSDSLSAFTNNNGSISIAIYLTVHTGFTNKSTTDRRRQGLHVQSRSYWAPANIGPYSQAISIPLASLSSFSKPSNSTGGNHDDGNGGPRLVTIAGQIPLVPATMALPPAESEQQRQALNTQLALSLQHLWRIGLEVGVQWWTSAVAYFPAATTTDSSFSMPMSEKARLAYKTWQSAHQWSSKVASDEDSDANSDSDDDDSSNGPDLWDRKFNPRYMSFAVTSTEESSSSEPKLPDWSVLSKNNSKDEKKRRRTIPPFFAAQVAELPRSAGVEWHAHLGVAKAGSKSVTVLESFQANISDDGTGKERVVEVHQTVVRSPASTSEQDDDDDDMDNDDDDKGVKNGASGRRPALLQTIMVERYMGRSSPPSSSLSSPSSSFAAVDELAWLSTSRLINQGHGEPDKERGGPSVMVRYVDVSLSAAAALGGGGGGVSVAVVPCASLWDAYGERLASVTIYQSVFE
ncbi:adenine nucleotide alpha hydrolases-like protein [Neurospora hispaniola]|uniref:Diphthine--ammonia ligase n=1 Tax=Neurospora hispaniola TaxID=588809 RepID=A0AAJ0MP16_9PEZI|nr:adenine nucleotide alpha hydrolases-like protein [Neurospora hispaniola]